MRKLGVKIKNYIHLVKAVDVNRTKASGTNIAHSDALNWTNCIQFNSVQSNSVGIFWYAGWRVVCGQPWSHSLAYGGHGGKVYGVMLEVGSAWVKPLDKFVKMEVERRKNRGLGNARRGIRLWCLRRGGGGGWECLSRIFVKDEVERREKILG